MARRYNAGEVFEMGLQVERNGHRFYTRAAEAADDPDLKQTLLELAEMEDDHEELFTRLKAALPADAAPGAGWDPDAEATRHLQAAADTHVFNVYAGRPESLVEGTSPEEVLKIALTFEKDSVVFFVALREVVPEQLGRAEVEKLIREEMSHIATLTGKLEALKERP